MTDSTLGESISASVPFQSLETGIFNPPGSKVLIDCWRIVENDQLKTVAEHLMWGVGQTIEFTELDWSTVSNHGIQSA